MKEHGWVRKFMQYGYDIDVFDKYRDAVTQYNRSALKVLGAAGCVTGVASVIMMVSDGLKDGVIFAVLLLAAGIAGAAAAWLRDVNRRVVQIAGYALCVAFYALSIVGNVTFRSDGADAFWIGVNMAMSCYLL